MNFTKGRNLELETLCTLPLLHSPKYTKVNKILYCQSKNVYFACTYRSGGVTDPEFEALESMVGEESAMRRGGHSHESGRNPLSSTHSLLLSNRTPFVRRTTFTQNQGKEPESPMQISPAPLTPSVPTRNESSSSDVFSPGPGSGARFCHECGNSYPSSIAKFCPECGERRVFKF